MSERRTSRRTAPHGAVLLRLLRLLLVLAAALGVVGMHAVGTGHPSPPVTAPVVHEVAAAAPVTDAEGGHGVEAVGVAATGAPDGGHGGADALLHLCLAVVGLGAVALAAPLVVRLVGRARGAARRIRRAAPRRVVVTRGASAPPWTHPTRAELCLWRL